MGKDSQDGGAGSNLDKLDGLVARIDNKKALADSARSDLGNIFQEAEDYGFNRAAIKFVLKLRNMEADKRNDFLRSVAVYAEHLDVFAQGDLFGAPGTPPPSPLRELTPYDLGRMAAAGGEEASRNPFAQGGAENEAWRDGWTERWAKGRGGEHVPADDDAAPAADAPKRRGRPRKTGGLVH